MKLKGFEVKIKCEGHFLKEYKVKNGSEDESSVSCWIGSEAGKVCRFITQ